MCIRDSCGAVRGGGEPGGGEPGGGEPGDGGPARDGGVDAGPDCVDVDGDGYGDNQGDNVWRPDACVTTAGTSTRDRWGCPDGDSDGSSDPNIELGWLPHPAGAADAFPDDPSQWEDADGDGFGDEQTGFK